MEDVTILDNISFSPNVELLLKEMRIKDKSRFVDRFMELLEQGKSIARPKAMYGIGYIEEKGDEHIVVNGTKLGSRILRVNVDGTRRVFPYVVTCGMEMHHWADSIDDLLEKFWAEEICARALRQALSSFKKHVKERFGIEKTSAMTPGSLDDWPLEQQRVLFDLLGDAQSAVGVVLTESCCMMPIKSLSGILFPAEENFASCMLCPRERCQGRMAAYDPDLYESRYGLKKE